MFSDNQLGADNQQERLFAAVLNDMPADIAWYIVGFTDGEGSFNVSFKREASYGIGWKVALSFNISQREEKVLRFIQEQLRCGTIRFRKDGVGYLEVRSLAAIQLVVIPFYDRYQLKSKKKADFEIFKSIVSLVSAKRHLTYSGMEELLRLREPMNNGGKRKFASSEILRLLQIESPETIRQIRLPETEAAK